MRASAEPAQTVGVPDPGDAADRRDEQVRHPWHFRLLVFAVTRLFAIALWALCRSVRLSVIGGEEERRLRARGPMFYATWHRGVLFAIYFWRCRNGNYMASASRDGEWAVGLIRALGNRAVRGSSSRGGRVAIQRMVEELQAGHPCGLNPDAPRGPAQVAKPGALAIAQRAGVPIVPVQFAFERCIRLKSWDRTMIPLPFTRGVVKFGEPFAVDPALEGEAFERRRVEFEAVMNRVTDEVDAYFR